MQSELGNTINPIDTKVNKGTKIYNHADSREIINLVQDKGFVHVDTSFGKPRNPDNFGFQKHVMIFEKEGLQIDDDNKMQLLVTNSHDTGSSLKFDIGIFRTICANGLVAGDNFYSDRLIHSASNFDQQLKEILNNTIDETSRVKEFINKISNIETNDQIRTELLRTCVAEKLKNISNLYGWDSGSFNPKRQGDLNNDLYTLFNRVQEVLLKGGLKYKVKQEIGTSDITDMGMFTLRNNTTRAVKSIDEKKRLNKFIWNEVEKFAA